MENNEKNSILIVDDEALNILALTQILGESYTLYVAKDGRDAIESAKEQRPDLILLDVVMPGMDGFGVITELKGMQETCKIPVIFITGLSNAASEEKGFVLGAADYINKPFTPAVVKLRVKNQLQIITQMQKIQELSITDSLTNISNRRHFNDKLEEEWQRGVREQTHLSVLMLDIDHFKNYNDTYGHMQGDIALQSVANILKGRAKRATDLVARWGGEEFAVVLPSIIMEDAVNVAERIREEIEGSVFDCKDGRPTRITVSIGVNCAIPDKTSSLDSFVSDTDKALYRAKLTGRNKVCTTQQL